MLITDGRSVIDPFTQGQRVEIILLTPHLAAELLLHNDGNRKLKTNWVTRLAAALERGEGRLTNDAITVSRDGTLLNGQNRCSAVVRSGVPLPVILLTGLEDESQDVMDSGIKRSLGDQLGRRGEAQPRTLAASLMWLARYQAETMRMGGGFVLTPPQALTLLEQHPSLRDAVKRAGRLRSQVSSQFPISEGIWSALIYLFTTVDADDCEGFLRALASGANLSTDDPILRLRGALIRERNSTSNTEPWRIGALVIKAWNFYRDGAPCKQLAFRAGGVAAETFPVIR